MKTLKAGVILFFGILMMGCGSSQNDNNNVKDSDSTKTENNISSSDLKVAWVFDKSVWGENEETYTSISLIVDGKTYKIASNVMGSFSIPDKDTWPDMKVPQNAITACMGWWAGAGDYYYAVLENGTLIVMHASVDEEMDIDKDLKYEKIKEINI
jgi:hypothetical protein